MHAELRHARRLWGHGASTRQEGGGRRYSPGRLLLRCGAVRAGDRRSARVRLRPVGIRRDPSTSNTRDHRSASDTARSVLIGSSDTAETVLRTPGHIRLAGLGGSPCRRVAVSHCRSCRSSSLVPVSESELARRTRTVEGAGNTSRLPSPPLFRCRISPFTSGPWTACERMSCYRQTRVYVSIAVGDTKNVLDRLVVK